MFIHEANLFLGVKEQVDLLKDDLGFMDSFLKDSEGKQNEHYTMKELISQNRDAAFEAENVYIYIRGNSAGYQREISFGEDVVIVRRTMHTALPFPNRIKGGFKDTLPDDLLAAILKKFGEVGDDVVGTVSAPDLQRATECRKAAFYAGFPGIGAVLESMTINKMNRVTKVNPKVEIFTHAHDCLLLDGITSENVVQRYGVTHEEQDIAAVR
ncbi:hypothetical protein FEM48_Zijuj12G0187300 [Ziziphus jujuba var. spinosa]|uniref:Disease resistance N-terminal domain-containing protein n=1 Tax=Ziziphus jujuba var. spinosa TaxID=714518 RepID=A0A978UEX4_ZIZJJ|nr:hypothetical protein FEM48_Zijuj12G0187300 [Ziziphus jujuba var. spinosa]